MIPDMIFHTLHKKNDTGIIFRTSRTKIDTGVSELQFSYTTSHEKFYQ